MGVVAPGEKKIIIYGFAIKYQSPDKLLPAAELHGDKVCKYQTNRLTLSVT